MDTTTALTLVVPDEFHNKINEIRKINDRAYPRWMPHINFIFPFISQEQFPEVKQKLSDVINKHNFKSFELELTQINYFKQGKDVTVNIRPNDNKNLANYLL